MQQDMSAVPARDAVALARERTVRADPARRAGADALSIGVIDTPAGMRALRDDWRRLEDEAAASHNFFQSFDWNMRWAEWFLTSPAAPRLAILAGREKGRLVMLWPLMIERDGPFRALKWLSDPFPQYGDALVARDVDRAAWLAAAWATIRAMPGVDCILLRKVREDAAATALLAAHCARTGEERAACYIEIGAFASHDEMLAALPSRRRQLRRKLHRKLAERGAVELRVVFGGGKFRRIVAETLRQKRQWLRDTGLISRAISDPRLDGLLASFDGQGEGEPRVAAIELTCDGQPVAHEVDLHYRGHHYLYIGTQNDDLAALSPSKVLIDAAQGWCIAHGYAVFDLLAPSDRYKRDLSDRTVRVDDFVAATGVWGMPYAFYLARLRPFLKTFYVRHIARRPGRHEHAGEAGEDNRSDG